MNCCFQTCGKESTRTLLMMRARAKSLQLELCHDHMELFCRYLKRYPKVSVKRIVEQLGVDVDTLPAVDMKKRDRGGRFMEPFDLDSFNTVIG